MTKRPTYEELKREIEELRERFQSVTEEIPGLICSFMPGGEITFVNQAYCRFFNKTPEDLIGSNFLDLIPESERQTVMENISALTSDSPTQTHEHSVSSPDGHIRWQRWTNRAFFDDRGNVTKYQAIGEDITEQRVYQDALRERIKELQCLYGISRLVESETDVSKILQKTVNLISDSWHYPDISVCRLRFDGEEYCSYRQCEDLCETCSHASIKAPIVVKGNPLGDIKVCYTEDRPEADEGPFLQEERALINAVAERMSRIIEQKDIEEALRKSEQDLKSLLDACPALIWQKDSKGRYLQVNQKYCDTVGIPEKDIIGKSDHDLFPKEIADKYVEDDRRCMNTGISQHGIVEHHVTSSGDMGWSLTDKVLWRDNKDHILGTIGFAIDITPQKRVEARLRASEELLKKVIDTDPNCIFLKDKEGRFLLGNTAMAELHGTTPEKMVGRTDQGYLKDSRGVSPEVQRFLENDMEVIGSKKIKFIPEESFTLPDGTVRWFQTSKVPLFIEEKGDCLLGVAIDITDRKHWEEALKESERNYRDIFESAPLGIFKSTLEGKVLEANPKLASILGYDNADDLIKSVNQSTIAEALYLEPEARNEVVKTIMAHREWFSYENQYRRKDGEVIVCDLMFRPLQRPNGEQVVEGFVQDITDRKQAAERLSESEKKFRTLFDTSPHAIALTDLKTGRFIDANETLCQLANCDKDELLGKTTTGLGFYSREDRKRFVSELRKNGRVHGMKMDFKLKDGTVKNTRMFAVPLEFEGETLVLISFFDVTDLNRLEAQLRHAQKMEAIGTLAGGVAHEFNNALGAIMGNLELLELDVPTNQKMEAYLERMKESLHRISGLTKQLLAYAQGGKYQARTLKMDDFVIKTVPILQHEIKPSVRLKTHVPEDIGYIIADQTQLQMVLSAIVANADEAIENEGQIQIAVENRDVSEAFALQNAGMHAGKYICLTVEDNGKGMSQQETEKIFDPFFSTKFQGRGMGMAAVYGIVKNHDGWISVDSELGRGTIVSVSFPAIKIEPKKKEKEQVEAVKGSGTILIIEDEKMLLDALQAMLERLGYHVLVATTGESALHIAEKYENEIHLALLDIKMPDMDGGDVYPRLMKVRPQLKVIVSSGYALDGPAQDLLDAGAQAFIQKPFSFTSLSQKVKKVMESS